MASTVESVTNILGMDRVDMNGKMTVIQEQHGSDGNFLLSSIIIDALKKDCAVCMVLFHNTFGHYYNVGMRLGCQFLALREKGRVSVVEPMRALQSELTNLCEYSLDESHSILVDTESRNNARTIYNLFKLVKDEYEKLTKNNKSVLLVVDDLSHLCDMGFSLKDSMCYIRYLRSMVAEPMSQLCVLTHMYDPDSQTCVPDLLANGLKHMAHLFVAVEPLKTGFSSDASGRLTVNWRINSVRREYHWPEKAIYLYKLMDRQVKIYAPGTAAVTA